MDLTPWTELIDAEIKKDISLNNPTLVAHILWEITFYGYSSEKINLEKDQLEKQIERLESGEEKLIPWEDINEED